MVRMLALLVVVAASCWLPVKALAQDEDSETVRRPVSRLRYEERERTVYRRRASTDTRETYRTVWVPVTTYRWESYWVGRWNPLVQPYLAQRLVPVTRWEPRTEAVRYPLASSELVPERQVVRVPVLERTFEDRQVARSTPARRSRARDSEPLDEETPTVARRERIGGVSRMETDPPRQGLRDPWRSANSGLR
jgi:hypothetical protein